MDFTLSDEQSMLRDTARALLVNKCPASLVRAYADDPSAADALWRHLREWVALGDGPLVDLCLFLEEMGAVVAPGPYFATAALFLPLLQAVDHPLVPQVVAGEVTGTVALAGRDGLWVANVDPVRTFVPNAGGGDAVDHVAVVLGAEGGSDGSDVSFVLRPASDLPARRVEVLDATRPLFEIDVPRDITDDHPSTETERVTISAGALDRVIQRATVALAAEMVGSARWLVQSSLAYAKERVQFDKPIGAFQGLQYKLVDVSLDLERAQAAVAYAAMAVDADDPDRHRAVHVAKAAAGAAVKHCAKEAMQIHAGIGYTWEHDLHLYLRRGYTSEALLGPSAWHHDRLAALIFD
jgi:alkylation response protein AidB-like acyl-CoA dehydrogenase